MPSQRVLHLSTLHPPEDVRIFWKECLSLARRGYEVHLMVPGEREEIKEGVHCHPLTPGRVRRILFPGFSRLLRLSEAFCKTLRLRPQLLHFHDPELIPVALAVRLLLRIPAIYDVHEDAPQEVKTFRGETLAASLLSSLLTFLESLARRFMSAFVVATPRLLQKFPGERSAGVFNYPSLKELPSSFIPYRNRPFWILYAGGIVRVRGALEMVRAMEYVEDPRYRLILLGPMHPPELLEELRKEPGFARVEYRGQVPRRELWEYLGRARVGLLLFHPAPDHLEALPNKLFEYMACGIPVVASNFPSWEEILSATGAGMTADPFDPRGIAARLNEILSAPERAEAMGEAGIKAVRENYNWENEEKKLFSLYHRLLPLPSTPL